MFFIICFLSFFVVVWFLFLVADSSIVVFYCVFLCVLFVYAVLVGCYFVLCCGTGACYVSLPSLSALLYYFYSISRHPI